MTKNRLCVAICAGATIPTSFLTEYDRIQFGSDEPCKMILAEGSFVQVNRSKCVRAAFELGDWDYLVFVDPDMTFPDNFRELAETWDHPIVGGTYFRRAWPNYAPVPGNFVEKGKPLYESLSPDEFIPMLDNPGLYPVDCVGTGCMGIRRDVLENWPNTLPPFATSSTPDGCAIVGEDVWFCWHASRLGIRPMLDTRIVCGHHGDVMIGVSTYRAMVADEAAQTSANA